MPGPAHMQDLTLKKYLEAWEAGSAEKMLETFSPDIRQRTMPLALGIPSRGRKEMEVFLPRLCECVRDWDLKIQHIVHDPRRSKASVFALATGVTPFGEYHSEYAVFMDFDESGEKIVSLDEMMDAAFVMEFFPGFKQYLARHC